MVLASDWLGFVIGSNVPCWYSLSPVTSFNTIGNLISWLGNSTLIFMQILWKQTYIQFSQLFCKTSPLYYCTCFTEFLCILLNTSRPSRQIPRDHIKINLFIMHFFLLFVTKYFKLVRKVWNISQWIIIFSIFSDFITISFLLHVFRKPFIHILGAAFVSSSLCR